MLNLAYPWLLLLALMPLMPGLRRPAPVATEAPVMPQGHWLSGLPGVSRQGQPLPPWQRLLLALAWLLLVLALARPQHLGEQTTVPLSGRDLLLAVDISPSMEERDMVMNGQRVNRLEALKRVLDDFISRRQGDRLGLLLFASEPYIQAPLTLDHDTLRTLLHEAGIGMAGRATAIGDALGLAVKRLRARPQEQRVVILLTDGANTAGAITPAEATEIATAAGVRIYTIGIGADTMVQQGMLGSRRINPSRDLDETLLRTIADDTGGRYFRARNLGELEQVYQTIGRLEPMELEGKPYRPVTELYPWPAGLAFALWLALNLGRVLDTRPLKQEPDHD